MAILIIGDGCTRNAQYDADVFACIIGSGSYILPIGNKMVATVVDNNTVTIASGACMVEGRVIEALTSDTFSIPTGTQGVNKTYYLGYKITHTSTTDSIESIVSTTKLTGSLRGGDSAMYIWLYSVKLSGIDLGTPKALVDTIKPANGNSTGTVTKQGTKLLSASASTSEVKLLSLSEINTALGTSFNASNVAEKVFCGVMNGDKNALSQTVTSYVKNGEVWVKLSANVPAGYSFRINYVLTATIGD